jgi:hypothetical protein
MKTFAFGQPPAAESHKTVRCVVVYFGRETLFLPCCAKALIAPLGYDTEYLTPTDAEKMHFTITSAVERGFIVPKELQDRVNDTTV